MVHANDQSVKKKFYRGKAIAACRSCAPYFLSISAACSVDYTYCCDNTCLSLLLFAFSWPTSVVFLIVVILILVSFCGLRMTKGMHHIFSRQPRSKAFLLLRSVEGERKRDIIWDGTPKCVLLYGCETVGQSSQGSISSELLELASIRVDQNFLYDSHVLSRPTLDIHQHSKRKPSGVHLLALLVRPENDGM